MRILVLDISGSTGFAVFDSSDPSKPVEYGVIKLEKTAKSYGPHPWGYVVAAANLADKLATKTSETRPDVVVVEETNGARARFTQKFLEYCHLAFLSMTYSRLGGESLPRVAYVNTSDWRRKMDVRLTPDDKRQNARLSRGKRKAANKGEKLDKKALGIRGRVTIKHAAIRVCNSLFSLNLQAKDDDIADALLIGAAYLRGVQACEGQE
jgi:hypothetical protein